MAIGKSATTSERSKQAGYQAAHHSDQFWDNPHDPRSFDYELWLDGYFEAQQDLDDTLEVERRRPEHRL